MSQSQSQLPETEPEGGILLQTPTPAATTTKKPEKDKSEKKNQKKELKKEKKETEKKTPKKKKKKKDTVTDEPRMEETTPLFTEQHQIVLTSEEQSALAAIVQACEAGNSQDPFSVTGLKRKLDFANAEAGTSELPENKRPAYAVSTSDGIHGILPNAEASSSSAAVTNLQIPLNTPYLEQMAVFPEPSRTEPSTKRRRGKAKHPFVPGGVGGKWLMSSELEKLGIPYKKGPFNTTEDRILKQALKDFGTMHNLDEEQMEKAIFRKRCKDTNSPSDVISSFWVALSEKLPERPVQAIYHRVRRMYHSGNYVGKWSAEEDELLLQLVKVQGFAWESISEKIGRMGTSCRDRYREIRKKDEQHTGKWTTEEEALLCEAIKAHVNPQGDIPWTLVSEKVKTRNESQCRLKWATINKPEYQESHKKWTLDEELTLVQNIYNSTAEEEDQVNWIEMAQLYFSGRSGPQLLKRFKGMRREIQDWASLEFADLMERMLERVNQKITNGPIRKRSLQEPKSTSEDYVGNLEAEMNAIVG